MEGISTFEGFLFNIYKQRENDKWFSKFIMEFKIFFLLEFKILQIVVDFIKF